MKYRLPNTVVRNSVQFVVCIAASFAFSGIAFCDWPGLLGTNRDGKASEQSSLSDKISGKPKMAWELPAGQGYAGASIAGDQVCLFDRKGRENRARQRDMEPNAADDFLWWDGRRQGTSMRSNHHQRWYHAF
ncbi:MAG: hypothetical protein MUD03_14880 [Pirellula sp.]|nr:hypothetical protein [Pirellula sp.]